MNLEKSTSEISDSASEIFLNELEGGGNQSDALESALNNVVESLKELNIEDDRVIEIKDSIEIAFKESLSNGLTLEDAMELALTKLNDLSSNDFKNSTEKSENTNQDFNLDFSLTTNTPEMNLLNEAMSKGMSVEEALKYVSDQMFPENTQGPPTLAELEKKQEPSNEFTAKSNFSKEEENLTQIEADMDSEMGNIINENTKSDLDIKTNNESSSNIVDSKEDEVS